MTVQASAYTGLGGLVEAEVYWPDLSPTKRDQMFSAWITEGAAKAAEFNGAEDEAFAADAVTRAWVKVRYTAAIYQRMQGNPLTLAVEGKGSSGFSAAQIQMALEDKDAAQAEWDALVAADVAVVAAPASLQSPGSESKPIRYVW